MADLTYLDNASTSYPKAPGVADAMQKFIAAQAANPGRAGYRMAVEVERMMDRTRDRLTRYFDGNDPNRMVFAMNCTDALNMAIKGVIPPCRAGETPPHVITTVLEHNSVSRPLQSMADRGQIALSRIDCDEQGLCDPADFKKAITPDTVLIVITHASNVVGTVQDAAAIGRIAREHDILFCLDAAQTAGVVPISVREMGVDLLAFPGHKSMLGPTGTGGLYVGVRCPEPAESVAVNEQGAKTIRMASYIKLQPWREGGSGGDSAEPTQPRLMPYYLEGGTPNTVGVAGLAAAMEYLESRDTRETLAHEQALLSRLHEGLQAIEGVTVLGNCRMGDCVGTLSFNVGMLNGGDVAAILDSEFDVAVRPGLHCAPGTHRRFGSFPGGTVRVSPGPLSGEMDIDRLIAAVGEIAASAAP
jgi:selenocysteine lyase/cysteine desulfurase